jgi:hypothetical protein
VALPGAYAPASIDLGVIGAVHDKAEVLEELLLLYHIRNKKKLKYKTCIRDCEKFIKLIKLYPLTFFSGKLEENPPLLDFSGGIPRSIYRKTGAPPDYSLGTTALQPGFSNFLCLLSP